MEDQDVIDAFVVGGARKAFGSKLHIEGDCLSYDGWWEAAFRIAPDTFAVRDEAPPDKTTVLADMASALARQGMQEVEADAALLVAITYTSIDLGAAEWTMWSSDAAAAAASLAARAGGESFLGDDPAGASATFDYAAEMGGARRSAGLPVHVVLAVGIDAGAVAAMDRELDDCRIEARAFGDVTPGDCARLLADLVLVDATTTAGADFLVEVRAGGRFIPLVAVTAAGPLLGADATVDPAAPPATWAEHLRGLLP